MASSRNSSSTEAGLHPLEERVRHELVEHVDPGDRVLLSFAAANRDPAVFADGDRFDIDRRPPVTLTFGFGVHYCLGAMLARMEMKALFSTILPHMRNINITGTPKLVESSFVSGLKTLPISYDLV